MKKILLSLLLVFVIACSAYGASSDDVYLRKDVFEMRMDRLEKTMERVEKEVGELAKTVAVLTERVNGLEANLSGQIAGTNQRINDLYNIVYWIFVLLGVLLAFPLVQRSFDWFERRRSKILTVEDVKKLINEAIMSNNLSLQGK